MRLPIKMAYCDDQKKKKKKKNDNKQRRTDAVQQIPEQIGN